MNDQTAFRKATIDSIKELKQQNADLKTQIDFVDRVNVELRQLVVDQINAVYEVCRKHEVEIKSLREGNEALAALIGGNQ